MCPDVRTCHIIGTIKLDTVHQVEVESCPVNIRRNRDGEANSDGGGGGGGGGGGVCVCVR